MGITYREIAEIVGVSRGTVDRALHGRGRIDPEVEKRILEVAKANGFVPSHVGRALARAKNPVKIGVIVHLTKIPFFKQVLNALEKTKAEIASLGGELIVTELLSLDPQKEIDAVNSLVDQGVQGIAISPAEDEALRQCLNQIASEKNIPIVTFNTDMQDLKRLCFVGMDNRQAGRTAAGLMNLLLAERDANVLIISGHITNQANSSRVDGFVQELADSFPNIRISGIQFNMDDEGQAYNITKSALIMQPAISGIYMVSGGQSGACRAIEETASKDKIRLIVYDTFPETIRYLKNGTVDFIIDQNADAQGSRPPRILFHYLFDKQFPENESMYTDIRIKTKYNV